MLGGSEPLSLRATSLQATSFFDLSLFSKLQSMHAATLKDKAGPFPFQISAVLAPFSGSLCSPSSCSIAF